MDWLEQVHTCYRHSLEYGSREIKFPESSVETVPRNTKAATVLFNCIELNVNTAVVKFRSDFNGTYPCPIMIAYVKAILSGRTCEQNHITGNFIITLVWAEKPADLDYRHAVIAIVAIT